MSVSKYSFYQLGSILQFLTPFLADLIVIPEFCYLLFERTYLCLTLFDHIIVDLCVLTIIDAFDNQLLYHIAALLDFLIAALYFLILLRLLFEPIFDDLFVFRTLSLYIFKQRYDLDIYQRIKLFLAD